MDRILTATRYMVLIGVAGLLLAALAGFLLAVIETAQLIAYIGIHAMDPELEVQEVHFIKLVDGFLISTGLLIFAIGLYEIFIHPLNVPEGLKFSTIGQLKSSLASIVALTLGVAFLALVQEGADPMTIFWTGLAIAVVIVALVLFARGDHKN